MQFVAFLQFFSAIISSYHLRIVCVWTYVLFKQAVFLNISALFFCAENQSFRSIQMLGNVENACFDGNGKNNSVQNGLLFYQMNNTTGNA